MKYCKEGYTINPINNRCVNNKNTPIVPDEIKKDVYKLGKKFINKKELKKLIYPFINRVSADTNNRIKYYNNIKQYFKFKNFDNKCLRFYKYNNEGKPIYRVGNSLILKNRIGSDSVHGIVFLSNFRDKYLNLYKFASKIVVYNDKVRKELNILSKLSKLTLENKCPHFPILYYVLSCNDFRTFDKSSFINSGTKVIQDLSMFPNVIQKNYNSRFILTLNELANGDLKMFMNNNINYSYKIYYNAFVQIFLSLIFFYQYINAFHNDAHWGNFLFHRIKSKGYFNYKIFGEDYYLKNLGYLWIIWDYELSIPFNSLSNDNINPAIDIYRIINAFIPEKYNGWVPDKNYKLPNEYALTFVNIKSKLKNYKDINYLISYLLITLKNLNIIQNKKPKNSLIINKTPFIINKLPHFS